MYYVMYYTWYTPVGTVMGLKASSLTSVAENVALGSFSPGSRAGSEDDLIRQSTLKKKTYDYFHQFLGAINK